MSAVNYGSLTDTQIGYIDGGGVARTQLVSQTGGASPIQAPWNVLVDPDTGLRFGSDNPIPTQQLAIAPQSSIQLEASHVFDSASGAPGPCMLSAFQCNAVQQAGWLLLYDAIAAPADGIVVPLKSWQIDANATFDWHGYPIKLLVGCVMVFSTSGPFMQVSSASAAFSAEVQ